MSIYLCISIDCECDKGPKWRCQKPLSFSGIDEGIGQRLHPLFKQFGAKPTYLFSAEVLHHDASCEVLRNINHEAEFGTHLHGEFVEPDAFVPDVTSAFQRDYDVETERLKLTNLTELFCQTFGYAPRSFRAGRFGIGPSSLGLLADLGYAVDSSVTPFMDWASAGAPGLSFRSAPSQPYWPDLRHPERPRAEAQTPDLLEIPVTIKASHFGALPLIGNWIEPRWLRPTRGNLRQLIAVAKDEIADARSSGSKRPIILNCMFHNVEVIPGASPYAQSEAAASAILRRLAGLLSFAASEGISIIGLTDAAEILAHESNRDV